jgi:leucyl-tRNA synthetase
MADDGLPGYEERYLLRDTVTYVVQVNGKVRGKLEVAPEIDNASLQQMALEIENVQRSLDGLSIKKVIVIPSKMISIAAGK